MATMATMMMTTTKDPDRPGHFGLGLKMRCTLPPWFAREGVPPPTQCNEPGPGPGAGALVRPNRNRTAPAIPGAARDHPPHVSGHRPDCRLLYPRPWGQRPRRG